MMKRPVFDLRRVLGFVDKLFGGELHAKRVLSLATATLGLLSCGTMRVHAIGQNFGRSAGSGHARSEAGCRRTPGGAKFSFSTALNSLRLTRTRFMESKLERLPVSRLPRKKRPLPGVGRPCGWAAFLGPPASSSCGFGGSTLR
jgi:hypothetical protein